MRLLSRLLPIMLLSARLVIAQETLPNPPAPEIQETAPDNSTGQQWVIQMRLVEFRNSAQGQPDGNRGRGPQPPAENAPVVRKIRDIEERLAGDEGIVVSRPQIRAIEGWNARIEVKSQSEFKYLQKLKGDQFELKKFPAQNLGIQFQIQLDKTPEDAVQAKVEFHATMLDGSRDGTLNIVGVDVPIGEPVIIEQSQKVTIHVDPGQDYEIALPTPPGKRASVFVNFMKVPGVPEGNESQRPAAHPRPLGAIRRQ